MGKSQRVESEKIEIFYYLSSSKIMSGNLIGEIYSPEAFIQLNEKDGEHYYSFLNGKIIHPTVSQLTEIISKADGRIDFVPREHTRKSQVCIGCKKASPCKSHLSDHFCPECFAKNACYLRTPDIVKKERYMGSTNYGSTVTVRFASDEEDVPSVSKLNSLVVKFVKGKLQLLISNTSRPIKDWCFYVEEQDRGERVPVFEIKDNVHFSRGILKGDFSNARIEGQPMCEDILKGCRCLCTAMDYPYHDSLTEIIVPRGLPGVFPMTNRRYDGKVLMCGKLGVRCAHRKHDYKKSPPAEDKGAQVKEEPKKPSKKTSVIDILDNDDPEIMKAKLALQAAQIKSLTKNFLKMQEIVKKLKSDIADQESINNRLSRQLENKI